MKFDIKVLRKPTDEDKLPPQARVVIATILSKAGLNTFIDRELLIAELDAAETGPDETMRLKTKQGAARILTFYLPRLAKAGLVEVQKTAVEKAPKEPKEPRAPKKAKEPAQAVA